VLAGPKPSAAHTSGKHRRTNATYHAPSGRVGISCSPHAPREESESSRGRDFMLKRINAFEFITKAALLTAEREGYFFS
jgi:hypothetical protein